MGETGYILEFRVKTGKEVAVWSGREDHYWQIGKRQQRTGPVLRLSLDQFGGKPGRVCRAFGGWLDSGEKGTPVWRLGLFWSLLIRWTLLDYDFEIKRGEVMGWPTSTGGAAGGTPFV
jgi:hypothetical protein